MHPLANYIYYSICEKSLEFAKKTHYMTYRTYCNSIRNSMLQQRLSNKEDAMIYGVSDTIRLIYALNPAESIAFIFDYFMEEKYIEFEEGVQMMKLYFKNSFY